MAESTSIPQQASSDALFREKAKNQAQSPDRLDELVRVVPPLGWLALWAILLALLAALAWGIFGRIPKTVNGQGILLRGGVITSIVAAGAGEVREILVPLGSQVAVGQVVARIEQPVLRTQVQGQEERVRQLKQRMEDVEVQAQATLTSQLDFVRDQREKLKVSIQDLSSQIQALQKVVKAQQELLQQGLIPLTTLLQSQTQLDTTQVNLIAAQAQLQQLVTTEDTARSSAEQAIFQARSSYESEKDLLASNRVQLATNGEVRSAHSGRVVGFNATVGDAVNAGTRLVDLEREDLPMSAVLFFPAGPAKRIQLQGVAQVAPETAPVARYGFIVGAVDFVAAVPATKGSMMSVLANDTVVESIVSSGPVLEVHAVLKESASTVSGYQWSSSLGPPFQVPAGTMCEARVIVEENRPIELVIPFLKKFFGIVD